MCPPLKSVACKKALYVNKALKKALYSHKEPFCVGDLERKAGERIGRKSNEMKGLLLNRKRVQ